MRDPDFLNRKRHPLKAITINYFFKIRLEGQVGHKESLPLSRYLFTTHTMKIWSPLLASVLVLAGVYAQYEDDGFHMEMFTDDFAE